MTKHTEEFSHLPFSQREGMIPIPGPLQLGELPDDLRCDISSHFYEVFVQNDTISLDNLVSRPIKERLLPVFSKFTNQPIARLNKEIPPNKMFESCESTIVENKHYDKVLDFLELCLNETTLFSGDKIKYLFEEYQAAYTLIYFENKNRWNFHPITSEANRAAVQHDLNTVEKAGYKAATDHFITASKAIKEGSFKVAIAQSHSATEAVAKNMTGKSTLGKALKKLQFCPNFEENLINRIETITAYANDYRHADKSKINELPAGQDEAVLMFSINAAIAGYLATKARNGKGEGG